jgi:adenine deaminase
MRRWIWDGRSTATSPVARPTTTKAPALEDAIARVRQGMKAMLRLGSAWYDVASQIKAITEQGLDSRSFILCTDDSHSGTLVHDGHMNRVVRHAIARV